MKNWQKTRNYRRMKDENGNVIDPMEPSAGTIYELMNTPFGRDI